MTAYKLDDQGRLMQRYSFSWQIDGKEFSTSFYAYSMTDAEMHVKAIRESATLDGQLLEVCE